MMQVNWSRQVALWKRTPGAGLDAAATRVADGPLGVMVSRAVALSPSGRDELVIRDEASGAILGWTDIVELGRRDDYPFCI